MAEHGLHKGKTSRQHVKFSLTRAKPRFNKPELNLLQVSLGLN